MASVRLVEEKTDLIEQLRNEVQLTNVIAVVGRPGQHISEICILCLQNNAVYVPIDSGYPEDRIKYILNDCRAKTIVVDTSVTEEVRIQLSLRYQVIALGASYQQLSCDNTVDQVIKPDLSQLYTNADDVAYIIYTSGSTGNPKGICISRGNLLNQLSWLVDMGFLSDVTRILQKTPIGFDAAQWEILAPLAGASVVAVGDDGYRDPHMIVENIKKCKVTSLQAVPTLLQAIVDINGFEGLDSLTTVFSGGEALSWNLVADIREQSPNLRIVNLYGPSECTINASAYVIDSSSEISQNLDCVVPLGVPTTNTFFRIQPRDSDEILFHAPGIEGELIIGGAQVGVGYINNSDETKKKFFTLDSIPHYRTGDVVRIDQDNNCIFVGRVDNQVKIRGNRVELDEISNHYRRHPWVSSAQCVLVDKPLTGKKELVACIQLSPIAAPLMDGQTAAKHHMSKSSRHQVKAQLSNPGIRNFEQKDTNSIEIKFDGSLTRSLEELAFSRKTYRTFHESEASKKELIHLANLISGKISGSVSELSDHYSEINYSPLNAVLLGISGYFDDQRLLPKYAYASPGSLYSIQTYIEMIDPLSNKGTVYYFHPLEKVFFPICVSDTGKNQTIHLVSHTEAISSVYERNVREVQYLELGHFLGLVDDILEKTDFDAHFVPPQNEHPDFVESAGDVYLGRIDIVARSASTEKDTYLVKPKLFFSIAQATSELKSGTYIVDDKDDCIHVSDDFIECHDVIAINQSVYRQASYGVGFYFDHPITDLQSAYASLGAALHKMQSSCIQTGFMSSGYSSFTGFPLPSALHAAQILDFQSPVEQFSFYFALAGAITKGQREHRGMDEDQVHMAGPAEIVTKEMKKLVPAYMVPDRTVVLTALPTTPNGKIDAKALQKMPEVIGHVETGFGRAPHGVTESLIYNTWSKVLKNTNVSAEDSFFDLGGDSIRVMMALSEHRRDFGDTVSPQLLFANPRLEDFAIAIVEKRQATRLIELSSSKSDSDDGTTAILWPGLGGLPFNLTSLAERLTLTKRALGIQASGINVGEKVSADIDHMAKEDIGLLSVENEYHLIGYSFGCRIAYTAASLLQERGVTVKSLTLICPGNPALTTTGEIPQTGLRTNDVRNPEFLGVLLSVFNNPLNLDEFHDAWQKVFSLTDAIDFIDSHHPSFGYDQVARITNLVSTHYQFDYIFDELEKVNVNCPIMLIKAKGDQYSSVDLMLESNTVEFEVKTLTSDHYEILKPPHVDQLAKIINRFQKSTRQKI